LFYSEAPKDEAAQMADGGDEGTFDNSNFNKKRKFAE
jgi:hypothetical protein